MAAVDCLLSPLGLSVVVKMTLSEGYASVMEQLRRGPLELSTNSS